MTVSRVVERDCADDDSCPDVSPTNTLPRFPPRLSAAWDDSSADEDVDDDAPARDSGVCVPVRSMAASCAWSGTSPDDTSGEDGDDDPLPTLHRSSGSITAVEEGGVCCAR